MTGLAIAAFVVSIVSLGWNIGLSIFRWPRIGVAVRQGVAITVGSGEDIPIRETYHLVVINRGAEAVTIANVGLRSGGGSIVFDYENEASKADASLPKGEELPARVEGHGCLMWEFDESLLTRFPPAAQVEGYAHRYRMFRKWPRSKRDLIKEAKTVVAVRRNGGPRPASS